MLVVAVDTTDSFRASAPEPLFSATYTLGLNAVPNYDVAPDGQRFLMLKTETEPDQDTAQIHVVLNWFQELTERVPVN